MYGNNNCNCNYTPCNYNRGGGFFANYQAFWIIVVIAIVIIWVHYGANATPAAEGHIQKRRPLAAFF